MKKFFIIILIYLFGLSAFFPQSHNTTWIGSIYTPTKAFDVKLEGRFAYVVGWEDDFYGNYFGSFSIIDIQFPSAPNLISSMYINDAYGIDVYGNFAYIAESNAGLTIYDISNPSSPVLVGQRMLPSSAKDVKVIGNLAYVAAEYAGLRIIDISNPTNPVEIGFFDSPGRSFDVEVRDTIAYLADYTGGFFCIDISNPTNPIVLNEYPAGDAVIDIDLKDTLAYYTDGYAGIKVLNISDPNNLELIGSLYIPYWCLGIKVSGDYAYVAAWDNGGLRIVDISDPANMLEVGFYNTWGKSRDVDVIGPLAYIADWDGGGLQIINNNILNPLPVELVSFSANYNDGCVDLSWITATELNNSGFEVERQTETGDWNVTTFIQGNGTASEAQHYFFSDNIKGLNSSKLFYRLKQIDFDGTSVYSKTIEVEINLPIRFQLDQNYPNPFNPVTLIKYQLPFKSSVTLKIFDILGKEIETLVNEEKDAGYYQISFDASSLSSGIYLCTLQTENYFSTKKMILLK
jgi:hypothetical protein